jgi:site-specific recombinase XerC
VQAPATKQLADFFTQLEIEQRVSIHTLTNYQRDLSHLTDFCDKQNSKNKTQCQRLFSVAVFE